MNNTPISNTYRNGIINNLNTKLLIESNDINGSTSFIDLAKGRTVTKYGSINHSNADKKFGLTSILLNGSTDYLKLAYNADLSFGTGQFTVQGWVKILSFAKGELPAFISARDSGSNTCWCCYFIRTSSPDVSYLYFCFGNSANWIIYNLATAGSPYVAGAWNHIAATRGADNYLRGFINGVKIGEILNTTTADCSANGLVIGRQYPSGTGTYYNGYIDNVVVTKGEALWIKNFTPPNRRY